MRNLGRYFTTHVIAIAVTYYAISDWYDLGFPKKGDERPSFPSGPSPKNISLAIFSCVKARENIVLIVIKKTNED